MLSSSTVYAIRACVYMATEAQEKYMPISDISAKLGISFHFLTKIFQLLTRDKILTSYRGPNGGVAFTKPVDEIFLIDIVDSVELNPVFSECILGIPGCSSEEPCPLHDDWGPLRERLRKRFVETSLKDLADKVNQFNERLK